MQDRRSNARDGREGNSIKESFQVGRDDGGVGEEGLHAGDADVVNVKGGVQGARYAEDCVFGGGVERTAGDCLPGGWWGG